MGRLQNIKPEGWAINSPRFQPGGIKCAEFTVRGSVSEKDKMIESDGGK